MVSPKLIFRTSFFCCLFHISLTTHSHFGWLGFYTWGNFSNFYSWRVWTPFRVLSPPEVGCSPNGAIDGAVCASAVGGLGLQWQWRPGWPWGERVYVVEVIYISTPVTMATLFMGPLRKYWGGWHSQSMSFYPSRYWESLLPLLRAPSTFLFPKSLSPNFQPYSFQVMTFQPNHQ